MHHSRRSRWIGLLLLAASFLLLVALFVLGRFVLVHKVVEASVALRALLADLAVAIGVAALAKALRAVHWAAAAALLLLAVLLHLANMEMAAAMDTFVNFADLRFAVEREFVRGSLHLSFPGYAMALLLASVFYLAAMGRAGKSVPIRPAYYWIGGAACLLGASLLSAGAVDWSSANASWLSVTRSIRTLFPSVKAAPRSAGLMPQANESGQPYFPSAAGRRRNVLFVVLEGIPGVYLRQVQEWTGVEYPIRMQALSAIAEKALVVPNFVNHNRQTIRGLYSLLSGDYCRLTLGTPKIYEYMQLDPASRRPCLPEILARKGYRTAYLQAADLSYMSKDRFMPEAGFQQVLGREYFRYQHVPFHWGPDDRAFFEQAAEFLAELERGPDPWFVTLLTVGTHHPGAVPEEFAARFGSRKAAAAAYLDLALADFMERLEGEGILRDTLVLLTADESHGVPAQPYGRFWGLAVARAPEVVGTINPGVFGLFDIPYSVLDYLGLAGREARTGRRSIFRKYGTERPILFESCFSERKGEVQRRLDDRRVEILSSANGELYSREYARRVAGGEEGRRLARGLAALQAEADSSLMASGSVERLYVLLEKQDFALDPKQSRILSWGQYLEIPGGATATVGLRAAARAAGEGAARPGGDCVRLLLRMMQENERLPLPDLRLPVLKQGESLDLSFSFQAAEPLSRIWAYLEAESVRPEEGVLLRVERFTMETREGGAEPPFQVHRLEVKPEGQASRRLGPP
jgi:arylsulfatase A-like enzyme